MLKLKARVCLALTPQSARVSLWAWHTTGLTYLIYPGETMDVPPSLWHFCEGWMNGLHQVCPVPHDHLISIIYARCLFALWSVPVITAGQSESRRAAKPREQSCCYLSSMNQAHFNLNLWRKLKRRDNTKWPEAETSFVFCTHSSLNFIWQIYTIVLIWCQIMNVIFLSFSSFSFYTLPKIQGKTC